MIDHDNDVCPFCGGRVWSKAPHTKYILMEYSLASRKVTTGGIRVNVYLCTGCRFVKIIHP